MQYRVETYAFEDGTRMAIVNSADTFKYTNNKPGQLLNNPFVRERGFIEHKQCVSKYATERDAEQAVETIRALWDALKKTFRKR